jgi:hypothetical protein
MLVLTLLTACADNERAFISCEQTRTEVAADEYTPLGFRLSDVRAWLDGTHTDALSLHGETTSTPLTITVTSAEVGTFLDHTPADDEGDGGEPVGGCNDFLELSATVAFTTADGAFAETWSVTLHVDQPAAADVTFTLPVDGFDGTYAIPEAEWTDCDESHAQVDLYFSENGGVSGNVWLACEKVEGDTAIEGITSMASWGAGEKE